MAASQRDITLAAGLGRRATVADALGPLESSGYIRKLEDGNATTAARYLLLTQMSTITINRVVNYGTVLCQAVRVRHPGKTYGTIGKKAARILAYVYYSGKPVSLDKLAEHIGTRKNALKARNIGVLLQLGLLVETDAGYTTPDDLIKRLENDLQASGIVEVEDLQRQKYEREREAFKQPNTPPVLIKDRVKPTRSLAVEKQKELEVEMVKNILTPSADGIVYHKADCDCWFCEEEAPEYVPMTQELIA